MKTASVLTAACLASICFLLGGFQIVAGNVQGHVLNVTALAKGPVELRCTMFNVIGDVMWSRPGDEMAVSRNLEVVPEISNRVQVISDSNLTSGERTFNLLIKFVRFPEDAGSWVCSSWGRARQVTNLVVLSPPSRPTPEIDPSDVSLTDPASDAWAFTCTSHFAFPPVTLTWVKVDGPVMDYDITPPSVVTSPATNEMALSVKLILSPLNYGSVFSCVADHPTFRGKLYNSTLHFVSPMTRAQPLTMAEIKSFLIPPGLKVDGVKFGSSTTDKLIIAALVVPVAISVLAAALLWYHRAHWQLNVGASQGGSSSSPQSEHLLMNGFRDSNNVQTYPSDSERAGSSSSHNKARRTCACKAVVAVVLFVLLTISLSLSIPVYFKGTTIPDIGADEMAISFAGSALWFDCSALATPLSSLLAISWNQNFKPFYKQVVYNGQAVGVALNQTEAGRVLGPRVTSQGIGQISIHPVMPEETGMYSCDVKMIANDSGRSTIRKKVYGVYVVTGSVSNPVLLAILATALVCAVVLAILAACHSISIRDTKQKGSLDDRAVLDDTSAHIT